MNTRILFATTVAALVACAKPGAGVRVVVPPGATMRIAAESLAKAGVLSSPRLFRFYASVQGRDRRIRAGTYELPRGAPWRRVLDALVLGRGLVNPITIPEGWELSTIMPALEKATHVSAESLQAAVRDTATLHRLDVPTPTLEGYLFPDTYVFPEGASATEIVQTMVREFEHEWKPEWNTRLQALAMTRHDIITLASIIEKEARLPEERPVISAVYHNRLRLRMLLQADPTVQFALGHHVTRVLNRDLAVKSPYNTYRSPGLPPGPIASPGRASIEAALFPADVKFLYFVAHPDGHHEFRRTLREHEAAVRQMRAEWKAQEQPGKRP
jgi:peptidoglycan lytic transglycosylase G